MNLVFDPTSIDDYRTFLAVKALPKYQFTGHAAEFPDEYAATLGIKQRRRRSTIVYTPPRWMFDYQRDVTALAIRKRKFACFMDCGLGKTPILLEFARHAYAIAGGRVLIVCPLMVMRQTAQEVTKFYGDTFTIQQLRGAALQPWLDAGDGIAITNYEAISDRLRPGAGADLTALILDESSMLKSHYGKWGTRLIEMGAGVEWKLCLTGTPAPNDRIEYANHAVFLDAFTSVNAFLARFFVNRGETSNRWELKPHALAPFYRALSHWSIFVTNPATYGWHDNCESIPPIHTQIHDVDLTPAQYAEAFNITRMLFPGSAGGIVRRNKLGQIAKGYVNGRRVETLKPTFVRDLCRTWERDESTIIWCLYNAEQEELVRRFPTSQTANITGATPLIEREQLIDEFKAGKRRFLITKPKILGHGLNLQIATRQVFSGLQDSYESFYQAVKRSNRYGSSRPLNVHIPITELERPMVDTVLSKASRVQRDAEEQEQIFKENQVRTN